MLLHTLANMEKKHGFCGTQYESSRGKNALMHVCVYRQPDNNVILIISV